MNDPASWRLRIPLLPWSALLVAALAILVIRKSIPLRGQTSAPQLNVFGPAQTADGVTFPANDGNFLITGGTGTFPLYASDTGSARCWGYQYDGSEPPFKQQNFFICPQIIRDNSGYSTYNNVTAFRRGAWHYVTTDLPLSFRTGEGLRLIQICGNGVIESTEICDDRNAISLDGCSSTCQIEPGFVCAGSPSICTLLPPTAAPTFSNLGDHGKVSVPSSSSSLVPALPVNCCSPDGNCIVRYGAHCQSGEIPYATFNACITSCGASSPSAASAASAASVHSAQSAASVMSFASLQSFQSLQSAQSAVSAQSAASVASALSATSAASAASAATKGSVTFESLDRSRPLHRGQTNVLLAWLTITVEQPTPLPYISFTENGFLRDNHTPAIDPVQTVRLKINDVDSTVSSSFNQGANIRQISMPPYFSLLPGQTYSMKFYGDIKTLTNAAFLQFTLGSIAVQVKLQTLGDQTAYSTRWSIQDQGAPSFASCADGTPAIVEYPLTTEADLRYIATGPDGNVWFSLQDDEGLGAITKITPSGVITKYRLPNGRVPAGIATGPDGNIWFAGSYALQEGGANVTTGVIGKMNTSGVVIAEYPIPRARSAPHAITAGPDGNMWFTEPGGGTLDSMIGKITPSGMITEYPIPSTHGSPRSIVAGPDGNLWYASMSTGKIGKITTNGSATEFPLPSTGPQRPFNITAAGGSLWFTHNSDPQNGGDTIGKISPNGAVTQYPLTAPLRLTWDIAADRIGNVWFTQAYGNVIAKIAANGSITEYLLPTEKSFPMGITLGPDGNMWFLEGRNKVGKLKVSCL